MNERIYIFIEALKKQLDGLPDHEINDAISYYEEYLNDADEAGKNINDILEELGPVEKIADAIKTETCIIKAQHSPNMKNFSNVLKNAFHGITTPMAIFILSLFIAVSFSVVVILYAGALVTFIGAVIMAMGLIYEAFKIPFKFHIEAAGTFGLALLTAGVLMAAAFGLFKLGRLMVRVSTGQIRWIRKKSGKPMPQMSMQERYKVSNSKKVVLACTIMCVVGLVLFSVSGLPVKYFAIFNSIKPDNINIKTEEYDPSGINKISLATEHSCIRLTENSGDKIVISYEQPDWLDYEMDLSGSMLSFYEKSNGRLPLFKLSSLHESRTELVVSLPAKYSPQVITISTTGGFVYIEGLAENINVKTYTGSIFLDSRSKADKINIAGQTANNGIIQVDGKKAGRLTNNGVEYFRNIQAEKTIELHSSRGSIYIE